MPCWRRLNDLIHLRRLIMLRRMYDEFREELAKDGRLAVERVRGQCEPFALRLAGLDAPYCWRRLEHEREHTVENRGH